MPSSHLTIEQKLKAVNSVYSNQNRYNIATYIYKHSPASPVQIIESTGIVSSLVSRTITEMVQAGVVVKTSYSEDNRKVYYELTPLGKKIITIL